MEHGGGWGITREREREGYVTTDGQSVSPSWCGPHEIACRDVGMAQDPVQCPVRYLLPQS
jgi:hypothetical protein